MQNQMIFKRYEIKYLLTDQQRAAVMKAMEPHMVPDDFGRSTIRNIYYDTDNYRLIRHSMEKPAYKEKLRLRSYHRVGPDDTLFVELKKKYRHVVYKRRILMPQNEAFAFIGGTLSQEEMEQLYAKKPEAAQISREMAYFRDYYQTLHPVIFLSYEREAFYSPDDNDFRVTFDENILSRRDGLSLSEEPGGIPLLAPGNSIMEIKTAGSIPLWMVHCLNDLHVYKTSYSKYGTAYANTIFRPAADTGS